MEALSNNHFSVEDQTVDAMGWLEREHPESFAGIVRDFPEWDARVIEGSAFDVDAMGVDVEWGSWLVDAIEATGLVSWINGEPYGDVTALDLARMADDEFPDDGEWEYETTRGAAVIHLSKVGGGTIGREYAGEWYYLVTRDGVPTDAGSDLHTGMPHSHADAAAEFVAFLTDSISY